MTIYDSIGVTYSSTRRADPRIGAQIHAALGDSATVINVGAGTGSYEPQQTVLAIEPSQVMIDQRPAARRRFCGRVRSPSLSATMPRMP